jgi:hypothetical protein
MKKDTNIQKETAEISKLVAEITEHHTYQMPEGYFNEMHNNLINKLNGIEHDAPQSPLLEKAGKGNILSTPTAYFDNLIDNILSNLKKEKTTTHIFSMHALKWAVAACIIGLIGFSIANKYFSSENGNQINKEWQASLKLSKLIIQKNSFDITLSQLDENTIINFLQENGHDVDAALMASITETEHINEVNEYFCDDENLNLMMKDLSISEIQ